MKIESFEKGCEIMAYDPKMVPEVSMLPLIHQKAVVSGYKLFVISEASWKGDGKIIDWNNTKQLKWSPYWWMNKPGFRFGASVYDYSYTYATSGSRLCYPSENDSDYHAEQHKDLYADLMVFLE